MLPPPRLSNLELLRIIAMFGVLTVHADFGALDTPNRSELLQSPIYCVFRVLIESFAIVSVNVFVLISGWFGINYRWKSLCNLLFQCAFFLFGIYILCVFARIETFSIAGIWKCLMLSENVWFVKAYLGMYIMAPVINAFVETATRKIFTIVLVSFFVFQSIYGWFSDGAQFFEKGYSAFSFIGLYMLARYVKMYKPSWSIMSPYRDIINYGGISFLTAACILFFTYSDKFILMYRFCYYTSPLVIAAALYLLLCFTKIPFYNKVINWIASSCFAVYLMHFILFPTFMSPWIRDIVIDNNGFIIFLKISILLLSFFTVAIFVDKIRLLIWNKFLAPRFS